MPKVAKDDDLYTEDKRLPRPPPRLFSWDAALIGAVVMVLLMRKKK